MRLNKNVALFTVLTLPLTAATIHPASHRLPPNRRSRHARSPQGPHRAPGSSRPHGSRHEKAHGKELRLPDRDFESAVMQSIVE